MEMSDKFEPINDNFEALTQKELSKLESSINCKLPSDYSDFLLKYGRCMFSGQASIKISESLEAEIFTMYGAKGDAGNILKDIELHSEYVAEGIIPIADDMFNNRYVLHSKSEDILFIDYSSGEATSVLVAKNFTDFIRKIEVIPDDE